MLERHFFFLRNDHTSDTVLEVPNCYFKEFLKHNINDSYKFQELAMFRKVEESIRRRNVRKDLVGKFDFKRMPMRRKNLEFVET